jgi:LuxR family maltose regulon positive regulatory protein
MFIRVSVPLVVRGSAVDNGGAMNRDSPVLRTKLRPPRVREGMVERPDLLSRLRSGRVRALTLICAPAGYGKTTLLAQWQALDRGEVPFLWVTLDERDSDPLVLWSHLLAAMPGGVDQATGSVRPPTTLAAIHELVLPRLVDSLDRSAPSVLVLDDWHLVRNPACDRTVISLIERAPEHIQIVVSSRSEPGLSIARLRAHGDLEEIRGTDLRMGVAEATEIFSNAGVALERRDVERLVDRTEGWVAALSLSLVALREADDPQSFVREFSGDTRHVFDYLVGDVLERTDPETREFLVRSSVLDRLSPPLCDAVLDRSDSASMLEAIERSNLFLVRLAGREAEYRYHHLFETVLRRELAAVDRKAVGELHTRASRWFEEHEDLERAVEHAIDSLDLARSSALVTVASVPMLSMGRMATVNRWYGLLSWPEAQADRQLAAVRALAAGLSGEGRDGIERWLRVAEDGPDFGPLANGISSIRSVVAMVSATYLSRGIDNAVEASRFVLATEPLGSVWRYAGLVALGQALYLSGRRQEARGPLEEAQKLPGARQRVTTALALAYLSLLELGEGRADNARRLAQRALALVEQLGHGSSSGAATPHLALGCVLMHGADMEGAIRHLEQAAHLAGEDAPSYWRANALVRLAAARRLLGDDGGARDALAAARAVLDELPDAGVIGDLYDEVQDSFRHRMRHGAYLGQELSSSEARILERLVDGLSVSQVAQDLWLSPNTVKTHRRNIYRKLGVRNRDELLMHADEARLPLPATADHPE